MTRKPASPALIADIGGSTSRFALAVTGQRPQGLFTLPNDSVPNIEAAIAQYLDRVDARPAVAVFAVAGPVDGDDIKLTNRAWSFRVPDLAARFGFRPLRVINDFEALAWALPHLQPADRRPIGKTVQPKSGGIKVALGPGTGLGVAALVPIKSTWSVVASEGGHATFGPQATEEEPVFARLRDECGSVSAEMILSGPGLIRLHRALHQGPTLTSEAIVAEARAGEKTARASVALFVRLLGRFAGDIALTFKATGGVYVCGGVALALGALLDHEIFRAAFEAHPPHQQMLAGVATSLISCEEPGLLGCAAVAEKLTGIESVS